MNLDLFERYCGYVIDVWICVVIMFMKNKMKYEYIVNVNVEVVWVVVRDCMDWVLEEDGV